MSFELKQGPELPTRRAKLYWLINLFLSNHLDVRTFCQEFEQTYNFDVDRSELSADELAAFGRLFDNAVMYSPFEDERKVYPGYVGETQVRKAALAARATLHRPGL